MRFADKRHGTQPAACTAFLEILGGLTIKDYSEGDKERWNDFVGRSKNGTFLFLRDYMDYHAQRYQDASLLVLDGGDEVVALLPANRRSDELISHEGLTYGGFLTDERITAETMLGIFEAVIGHLGDAGLTSVIYKTVPHIYHRSPAEEDLYALFRIGAELYRRDLLSTIDYQADIDWDGRRRGRARKAAKATREGVEVRETDDYAGFWELLAENLDRRYGLEPVHTVDEITLLAELFPEQIRFFGAYRDNNLEAGAVIYLSAQVCHVQYSASSIEGRRLRALDLVIAHLIEAFHGHCRYFDFGSSTEQDGTYLNLGLAEYKHQFGARSVAHDFYRLSLANR